MSERIVVVGAGPAGLRAAERVRERGFTGELIVVGEEPYRPYHRPGLIKPLLTGRMKARDLRLPVLTELDATWRYNTRASHVETDEHVLHLPGGEEIQYDGLIIATGAQARHFPGAPRHDARVHVMRTVADAVALQKNLSRTRKPLVIIGGGFVACELASAARSMGRDATIIVRGPSLLRHVPGDDFGETVSALHEANGVQIVTNAWVHHWVPQPDGIAMHLNTGQVVFGGAVVLAVGSVPAVNWLRGSGLILDDGIMCGPTCHAIGAQDIVVAGDAARWPNLRFDTAPRRVEHWLNAVEMGRAAAENLLAGPTDAKPYTPLPRFWSDQHGMRIQGAGTPALAKDTVLLTGPVSVSRRVTGYVTGGNLVGLIGWDTPPAMLKWTKELEKQTTKAMRLRLARRTPTVRPTSDATTRLPLASLTPTIEELPPIR